MRTPILNVVAGLVLALFMRTAGAEDWPFPQNPEKARKAHEEALAWTQHTLADPYETVGKKDPRWDDQVRALLKLAVPLFTQPDDIITHDEVFQAAKTAIDAGCDDPIVLFIYARTSTGRDFPGPEEYDRRMWAASTALESSKYPAFRRAAALMRAGARKLAYADPASRQEARRCLDAALALVPESMANDGLTPFARRAWFNELVRMLENQKALIVIGSSMLTFKKVDAALEKVPDARSLRLALRGSFYIEHAWEARGNAVAAKVTEDGWRRFAERVAEARKALEEAWSLDHDNADAATLMITVEMAIGDGERDAMERWFQRAMEADPNNRDACKQKLLWLEPKWHGSLNDMLTFARACRDSKNWQSRITLLPAEAHRTLAGYLPLDERVKYYQLAQVWDEIRSAYLDYLTHAPDDEAARSEYAGYCYLCSQYAEARAQFQKLGDHLDGGRTFTEKWLKETRLATAERVRGGESEAPPAKGFAVLDAHYGADKAWVDVTARAKLEVANDQLKFNTTNLPDPIFGVRKALAIAYSLDGKVGLSVTVENEEVTLPPKDREAPLADVPAQGFAVLVAKFGVEQKWVDVTDTFRKRTVGGKVDSSGAELPDPAFGVHKALVIVYAWEGKVFVAITRDDVPVTLPVVRPPGPPQ